MGTKSQLGGMSSNGLLHSRLTTVNNNVYFTIARREDSEGSHCKEIRFEVMDLLTTLICSHIKISHCTL